MLSVASAPDGGSRRDPLALHRVLEALRRPGETYLEALVRSLDEPRVRAALWS